MFFFEKYVIVNTYSIQRYFAHKYVCLYNRLYMPSMLHRVGKNPGFFEKKPAQWVFSGFFGFFRVFRAFSGFFGFCSGFLIFFSNTVHIMMFYGINMFQYL